MTFCKEFILKPIDLELGLINEVHDNIIQAYMEAYIYIY